MEFKTRNTFKKVGTIIGVISAAVSMYAFFQIEEKLLVESLFVFYLPACLALIASIEDKHYLMFLAFLLNNAIYFLDIKFSIIHMALLFLYLLSYFLMNTKNKQHNA